MSTGTGPETPGLRWRLLGALTAVGRPAVHALSRVMAVWQRSIQLRVVTATLALSLAVVVLLGASLLRQVADGLLDSQREAAVADATAGINTAQLQLDAADDAEPAGVGQLLTQLVQDLVNRAGPGGLYDVVLVSSDDGDPSAARSTRASRRVDPTSVPTALREAVVAEPRVFSTYTEIVYPDDDVQPGLAVGGQIAAPVGGLYEIYYLYPLTEQQQTLDLVRRALATAGLLLVLLLGAIAGLVTRQVVTPVRLAARIAERFASGRLEERMSVRGRDDIARLASSFNQMAGSLQRQITQLEDLSRVQQRFASDVSHELRTPLTTVRMAADVLHEARDDFDPAVRRSAELLQDQLDRFEALLTDLLEISRFDAGAAALETETVDLRDIVLAVVDSALPVAQRTGTGLVTDLPETPCTADVDTRRVERVLRNLVVNAVEHGEGRDVGVSVRADEDAVAVCVRDHGVGLKPGESSLVFHRFWRADPARARTTGGSGLGLSIALEDTRLHGGWLQAWGEPGQGSQFRLTLPRRAGAEVTRSPLPLAPVRPAEDRGMTGVGGPYRRLAASAEPPTPTDGEPAPARPGVGRG
jgi:two-component system, OmpR family, sensor histidine kinase MtrB